MGWKVGWNANVSEILGNNYKDIETNFDAKDVTIPFQNQQRNLTKGKCGNKQQFRFDVLRSQDAENAIGVFKTNGKLGG